MRVELITLLSVYLLSKTAEFGNSKTLWLYLPASSAVGEDMPSRAIFGTGLYTQMAINSLSTLPRDR